MVKGGGDGHKRRKKGGFKTTDHLFFFLGNLPIQIIENDLDSFEDTGSFFDFYAIKFSHQLSISTFQSPIL